MTERALRIADPSATAVMDGDTRQYEVRVVDRVQRSVARPTLGLQPQGAYAFDHRQNPVGYEIAFWRRISAPLYT